jgi:phage repressor protein C with HTH and peptisase S24 domain
MAKNNENIATIHERMAVCVKLFGEGKNTVFADKLGVSEGNIRGYIKGVVPKADVLEKIVRTYDVSPKWLLTGEGEINQIKTEKNSDPSEISSSISLDPSIGSPFYDVDFIGGFDEIFNSQTVVPACNIVVPGFEKASLWCNVTGHSMEPKICHGDIIALHECTVQDIQYGEIYAVVLDSFRTIKILRKGTTSDVMRYVPINPDFDDQEFPVSRILRIFEVLGSIAKFF